MYGRTRWIDIAKSARGVARNCHHWSGHMERKRFTNLAPNASITMIGTALMTLLTWLRKIQSTPSRSYRFLPATFQLRVPSLYQRIDSLLLQFEITNWVRASKWLVNKYQQNSLGRQSPLHCHYTRIPLVTNVSCYSGRCFVSTYTEIQMTVFWYCIQ